MCAGPDQQAFRDVLRSFKKANSPRKLVTFLQEEAAAGSPLPACTATWEAVLAAGAARTAAPIPDADAAVVDPDEDVAMILYTSGSTGSLVSFFF